MTSGFDGGLDPDGAPAPTRDGATEGGPVTAANLLDPAALRALQAHPDFQATAQAFAQATLDSLAAVDPETRWMIADLGRSTLYVFALVLAGIPGGLTVASLKASAAAYGVCSAGRVTAFVDHCLRTGRLALSPGVEPWTRRRLATTSAFIQPLGRVLAAQMRAVSPLAPELAAAAERLSSDTAVTLATTQGVRLTMGLDRRDLGWLEPLRFFMERDGGMRLIEYLLARQGDPRSRLLERTSLNKAQAARACAVSRRHLDNLLGDAEAAGLATLGGDGTIELGEHLGAALGGYYAAHVRAFQAIARAIDPGGAAGANF